MNIKKKLFIVGVIILLEIFANINIVSAQITYTTCNSAVINNYVTPNSVPTNAWFEWGFTQYFGNSTPRQIFYSNSNFSQLISGLTENTTYYYRVMSSNNYGTTTGYTKSFSTSTCPVLNPTAVTTIANRNTTTITNIKNTVKDEEITQIQQGALAFLFGGDDFFPNTLLGWLLLILVIILLILAVKKAYYESRTVVVSEKTEKKHS
ncbi:MAG: hypothetical protein AAB913_02250 [Patescibacteria group bacterium]